MVRSKEGTLPASKESPGPGLDSEALVAIVRSSARQEGQEKLAPTATGSPPVASTTTLGS